MSNKGEGKLYRAEEINRKEKKKGRHLGYPSLFWRTNG
jgi:hypothetical protein